MGRLNDKIAIITGAASGIGRAGARRFAEESATVVVADIRVQAAEEVAHEIVSAGGMTMALGLDAGDEDQSAMNVLGAKLTLPHTLERRKGSIVFAPSGRSMGGDITAHGCGSSKAALNWFVHSIATPIADAAR
jgi:NAD(P)-dependent dehydrogenase (short-subunit alcohol dehydrogenase family)